MNRLRNLSRLFGHLLANGTISWTVLQVFKVNEVDAIGSSRIFDNIMMQEVTESMVYLLSKNVLRTLRSRQCDWHVPIGWPKRHALLYQLLYEYRTWRPY